MELLKLDIEALVKSEAPKDDEHDQAYAKALREVYQTYKNEDRQSLLKLQESARIAYGIKGPTHYATAACVVLYEMLCGDYSGCS